MTLALNRYSIFLASFVFLVSFFALSADAQSPRHPAKPRVPEKPLQLGKSELLNAGKLSAIYYRSFQMDSTEFEIKSYKVSVFAKDRDPAMDMVSYSDSIPARILERIKTYAAGSKVFFEYVKAIKINSGPNLHSLPPLSVTLTGD
jgi:hypothetical protein